MITSSDAKDAYFKSSKTSCDMIISSVFLGTFGGKKITWYDGCVLLIHALSKNQVSLLGNVLSDLNSERKSKGGSGTI